ncbi:hypothetical protein ABZ614_41705 [Streptomyces sp. NPDC013178]|uniref:hypothetical protein n=1 Tax=Streptomyces sp. NPDC013178 TaxID=3155118 RepID=UPI003404C75F
MTVDGGSRQFAEGRLRQALEARAESVTVRDLRPSAPPRTALRRTGWRRVVATRLGRAGLAALAAVVVAGTAYVTRAPEPPDMRPLPPAAPPQPSTAAPPENPAPTPGAPLHTRPGPAPLDGRPPADLRRG